MGARCGPKRLTLRLPSAAYDHCSGSSLKEKVSAAIGQVAGLYKPRMSQVPPRAGGEWEELPEDDGAEGLPSMEELDEVAHVSAAGAGPGKKATRARGRPQLRGRNLVSTLLFTTWMEGATQVPRARSGKRGSRARE